MSDEVLEAAQCLLENKGVVLYPLDECGLPPLYIKDEDLVHLDLRIFSYYNKGGALFTYTRHEEADMWIRSNA